jgi:hypothetical protein
VGDDFQTLILMPRSTEQASQRNEFMATFQDDEQRAMWSDRDAQRWVRFERA